MKSSNINRGRPYGGTAIIMKTKYKEALLSVNTSDPRMILLKMKSEFGELMLVNVYLPCNTTQNADLIYKYLNKIHQLASSHDGPC